MVAWENIYNFLCVAGRKQKALKQKKREVKERANFMAKIKTSVPSEAWEQEQLFKWSSVQQISSPELRYMVSSMAGVRLSMGAAVKAKRQGNKPGFPDIFLPVNNGEFNGLFIELKRIKNGVASTDQIRWIQHLSSQGFKAVVCNGWQTAVAEIKKYLGI